MKIAEIGFVYMITSPVNKIYVGSTIDIEERWKKYYNLTCKNQSKLYNSFKKHGVENHTFEIVWAGHIEKMYKYEAMIGLYYEALNNQKGLTLRLPKVDDIYSYTSQEARDNISKSKLGIIPSIVTREKLRQARLGSTMSTLSKKKLSNSRKIGHLNGTIKANRDRIVSLETRDKLRAANLGKKHDEKRCLENSLRQMKKIYQYDLNMNFVKEWIGAKVASKELNIDYSGIIGCCNFRQNTAGKFKWSYIKNI